MENIEEDMIWAEPVEPGWPGQDILYKWYNKMLNSMVDHERSVLDLNKASFQEATLYCGNEIFTYLDNPAEEDQDQDGYPSPYSSPENFVEYIEEVLMSDFGMLFTKLGVVGNQIQKVEEDINNAQTPDEFAKLVRYSDNLKKEMDDMSYMAMNLFTSISVIRFLFAYSQQLEEEMKTAFDAKFQTLEGE